MNHNEVAEIYEAYLSPLVSELYELEGYETSLINAHAGGRNVVYNCEKEGASAKILRIAFLNDRSREDLLGEVEYIQYLFEHGGSVSNVISSREAAPIVERLCSCSSPV
ncbi:hypothetical protein ACQKND_12780 [Viridibacillus arvi]|uniref:hypothetical protein n=1 Tax=Viridibacillus arvi TaxID=263475 RepID=UPI003CFF2920